MPSSTAFQDRRHAAVLGVLSLFVLGVAAWLVVAALLPGLVPGWRSVVVTSGSMEPSISAGDVVLVAPTGPGIEVGSVVLFSTPTGRVTHRIIGVNDDGTFATKGDANPAQDSTALRSDSVVGRARLVVPNAGLPTLWIKQGAWAPLFATALLLAVTAAALGVAVEVWRSGALHSGSDRRGVSLLPTVATVVLGLALIGTSTSASTARAAFNASTANGASSFVAASLTQYRLVGWGPGDQASTLLLPIAKGGSPTATVVPNTDNDRNADAGLTLLPTTAGLAETDRRHFQIWYEGTGSGLALDGPTQLRLWTAMKNKGEAKKGDLFAGLYDCRVWPVDCTLIASATAAGNGQWGSGALSWGESVFDFGDPAYTLGANRYLAVKVVAADVKNEVRIAFDTVGQPSALEVAS